MKEKEKKFITLTKKISKKISPNSVILKVLRWMNALASKEEFVRTALTRTGASSGSVTD